MIFRLAIFCCLSLQQLPPVLPEEVVLVNTTKAVEASDEVPYINNATAAKELKDSTEDVRAKGEDSTRAATHKEADAEEYVNATVEDYSPLNVSIPSPVAPQVVVQEETVRQDETTPVQDQIATNDNSTTTTPAPPSTAKLSSASALSQTESKQTTLSTSTVSNASSRLTAKTASETVPPNVTAVQIELGKLTIHPLPPVIEYDDSLELFCSIGYHDSASIVWTLNDQPLEDIVVRSHISGRKDFFVKSLRIQVDHLATLPSVKNKYVFECVASVDGNLVKDKVEIPSTYQNTCVNDTDCARKNAYCRDGKCHCDDLHPVQLNSSHITCRSAARLGWPCSYTEQCVFADSRSECGNKGECTCIEGYDAKQIFNSTLACVSRKGVNTACQSDTDCNEVGAVCAASATCQCPAGSLETNGRCVQQNGAPMSPAPIRSLSNSTVTTDADRAGKNVTGVAVKKMMPVRILKVREFPRVTPAPDRNVSNFSLDGLVRLEANDSNGILARQRVLTSAAGSLDIVHFGVLFCASWWVSKVC